MSKLLIGGFAAIAIAACSTIANEAHADTDTYVEGPALWKLQDEDTAIHLFGVAPVLKTGTEWQSPSIKAALNAADLIVLETDQSPAAQSAVQALIPAIGIYTDGSTLSSTLSDEEREDVNAISAPLGAPLAALDQLKPWLASVQLGVLAISQGGFDLTGTPAARIAKHAAEAGTPLRSFESATQLMELMARFPVEEQTGMLMHTARTLRDDPHQQAKLAEAWLAGDVAAIGAILHDERGAWSSETIYNVMLVKRNKAWTGKIGKLLKTEKGDIFIAVGFGHLAGEDSLIGMLEAAGHKVVRQ
jgi:uncharacterized protein YbaP (TraB family)